VHGPGTAHPGYDPVDAGFSTDHATAGTSRARLLAEVPWEGETVGIAPPSGVTLGPVAPK